LESFQEPINLPFSARAAINPGMPHQAGFFAILVAPESGRPGLFLKLIKTRCFRWSRKGINYEETLQFVK